MKALIALISQLMDGKFYGELRVKFNSGQIVHVCKEESIDISPFQHKEAGIPKVF